MFNSDKAVVKENKLKTAKPNNITAGKLLIVFSVFFIPVIALKAYHMLKFTDPETGFFTDRSDITVYLYFIITVAGVLFITLFSYLSAKSNHLPDGSVFRNKDVIGGILLLGTAGFMGYRAFDVYTELSKIATTYGVSLFAASKLEHHNVFYFAQFIFGALGALWLVLYAVSRFAGKNFCTKVRVFSLAPALWGACRVIEYFTVTMSYLNVAELFCDIFTSVLSMVFLFVLARCAADVEGDNAVWSVFAAGLSLSLIGFSTQLVRAFLLASGKANLLVSDRPFSALFFTLSVLGLWTVIKAVMSAKKVPATVSGDWNISEETPVAEETLATEEIPAEEEILATEESPATEEIPAEESEVPDKTEE